MQRCPDIREEYRESPFERIQRQHQGFSVVQKILVEVSADPPAILGRHHGRNPKTAPLRVKLAKKVPPAEGLLLGRSHRAHAHLQKCQKEHPAGRAKGKEEAERQVGSHKERARE